MTKVESKWKQHYGPIKNAAEFPQFKGAKDVSPNFIIEAVPVRVILEDFLLNVQVRDPVDAEEHTAILICLVELLRKDEGLKADVFLMNNLIAQYRTRDIGRGFAATHQNAPINQYFSQSAGTVNDTKFCSNDRISLQLRRFNLGTRQRDASSADIANVTWYALNVPAAFGKSMQVEGRG